MTHTITYDPRDNIIELKIQGDLTLERVKDITAEVIKVSKAQKCFLILNDLREATIKLSLLEIYELPKTVAEIARSSGLRPYDFRQAFVARKGQDHLSFFENVSVNRGQ